MSIKYCFNQEIHKTFNLPCDFSTLVKDIGSLFVQKLPTTYLLQYEDADGDKIAITNDQEYQTLVKQELPTALSSVKIYVTSLSPCQISDRRSTCTPKTNSEGSFEIVENEKSLELEEIRAVDHLREENLDSKVVISLQIPNQPKLEENLPENVLDNQKSFCSSVCAKSGPNESRDLVQEMSLSMDEDQSFEDAESCHKPGFNQAFQTEEENLSLSEKSPRKSPKKSKESQGKTEEKKKVVAVELSEFKPKSSSNLSKYLSRIIQNKSSEQSPDRLAAVLCSKPVNRVSEDKYREDSPERWVSFSSQPEEIQRRQGMELHGKSLFTLKQKPEAWFLCNQDRSYRYRESEDEELNCNGQSLSKISERSNNCQNSFRELMQEDFALKDEEIEERKGRYRELKIKQVSSRQASVEISFRENTDDLLQDIWFDLQCQPKTERKNSCRDGEAKKDIVFSEESVPDNGEALNISLLTASEAKRIASAIGSITRIEGVKKLRIPPESNIAQEVPVKAKVTSPVCSRWACRRSDIKFPGEEDWPFLKQPESTYNKKETCTPPEDQVHEGSFCMGCWRSPIRGVRYVCLVCDDIEYCENCEIKINHCHPLLKIKEPIGTLQDFMENLRSKLTQKSEAVFTPKGELSFKEESIYKDMDALGRSLERSLNLDNYQSPEEVRDEYKFEYKEVSTTPLMIKSNKKEWCVVYKTICLRNAGNAMWKRCHFEPVGVIPGTITEVSYVAPGDSVLITLEIHGFFAPGKYNSMWRVVHQGELDELCEMGYINLEFEVMENRGNGFCDQGLYEKDDHEALFYGKKLGPMDFY